MNGPNSLSQRETETKTVQRIRRGFRKIQRLRQRKIQRLRQRLRQMLKERLRLTKIRHYNSNSDLDRK